MYAKKLIAQDFILGVGKGLDNLRVALKQSAHYILGTDKTEVAFKLCTV